MMLAALLAGSAPIAVSADGAATPPAAIQASIDAAITACERWLLDPATWIDGADKFPRASGLADRLVSLAVVPDVALPPPAVRQAMHHWRVPIGDGGVFVTVSDRLPICHLAGGGPDDFQPGTQAELVSPTFRSRWVLVRNEDRNGLRSSLFANKANSKLTMILTRAGSAGARRDRVQLVATAQYSLGN